VTGESMIGSRPRKAMIAGQWWLVGSVPPSQAMYVLGSTPITKAASPCLSLLICRSRYRCWASPTGAVFTGGNLEAQRLRFATTKKAIQWVGFGYAKRMEKPMPEIRTQIFKLC
jgi:hypothetical protein